MAILEDPEIELVPTAAKPAPGSPRPFTVDEVMRMLEVGILDEDEPVELLEGELVLMSPQDPKHANRAKQISRLLERLYGSGFDARCHSPLQIEGDSLPEPDVAVVRGDGLTFEDRHPEGKDALLVVEITSSSHGRDRRKAQLYARAGVPTYWLLDLPNRRLEVRTDPRPDGEYALTRLLGEAERVAVPETGEEIAVAELLPPGG
jgi:Uma2 family endonuclease